MTSQSQPIQQNSSTQIRIPSASKLWLFDLCPRAVIETKEPINRQRVKAQVNSAAYNGQMLHQCLEVFVNYRVNLKQSLNESYEQAKKHASKIGVFPQFIAMKKQTMDLMSWEAEQVITQVPLLMDKYGNVRRARYNEATVDDILVGTADCIIKNTDGSYTIADWKTGLDDVDGPQTNHQLMGLAFMAQRYFGFETFHLKVNNPIVGTEIVAGPFTASQFDIASFIKVDKTRESAGDHCRYCPLRGNCVSYSNMMEKECQDVGIQVDGFFDPKHG